MQILSWSYKRSVRVSISVGRYNLTNTGGRDVTDDATYVYNKIGNGSNNVMGIPRSGVEGYTPPAGLISKPAIAEGAEALMDMTKAFTITSIANETNLMWLPTV